jgi:tetratricopeptide (TPR) repeat protein
MPVPNAPEPAGEQQQLVHHQPITYQNPFANMSKSPPNDSSLRPGPIARWRRPTIQHDEHSPIKSAMLSTPTVDTSQATASLPPPDAIRFPPKPLTQPTWLSPKSNVLNTSVLNNPFDDAGVAQSVALTFVPGAEHCTPIASAFDVDLTQLTTAVPDASPEIAPNCPDTAENWQEEAQHAASTADSPDDLSAVIQLCDRGMRSTPDDTVSKSLRRLSAWAHNRRGELQAEAGADDDSLSDFQAAIALDPACSLAFHNRAVSLAQQNQFDAALRDFNRVIELNPGLAVAYRNRAELLSALGRMEEAVADYSQAIEGLPDNTQLFRGRAYANQRLGHFREAAADLNRALDINPNDAETLTQRGNLAAEQGDFEQAVKSFQRAIAANPNWTEAHRSLGWLQATCPNPELYNPQQAIAAAEQAAKLSLRDDYLILDTLAAARASAGQFKQAIEIQEKAVACAPPELAQTLQQRLSCYHRGIAYRPASSSTRVRRVSHESPVDSSSTGIEAP